MNKLLEHWFSYLFIAIWLILYLLSQKFDLTSKLANTGMSGIGNGYYRFGTALLLHGNLLHVLWNAAGLYFADRCLEPQIDPWKLLLFSLAIGIATEAIFAAVYRNAVSVGGSPMVFALIGLIVALQIARADQFAFRLGTPCTNWILCYAVFSNIPLFSTSLASTLLIHGVPTVLGILLGYACVLLKLM